MVRDLTLDAMADVAVLSPAMVGAADVGTALTLTRKGGTCVLTGLPSPAADSIAVQSQDFILIYKTLRGTVFGWCKPQERHSVFKYGADPVAKAPQQQPNPTPPTPARRSRDS
ncbi:hypothetical protein [Mycobacterium riyadhense]|uniref:hypothetical protein n=1 Tax=Mycobacterium riyadhense TaxID=486698 RepID=UPI001EF9D272|nr:hypothetical protein [Mycobacterium riyadhense]